jgi:hypothetical protein
MEYKPVNIKLVGNAAFLDIPVDGHGTRRESKILKVETLCNAFREQEKGIQTPYLPVNTLKYQERGNSSVLYLYSKEQFFNANVGDTVYENCIRPSLILVVFLNQSGGTYKINDSKCFAVKEDRLLVSDNTRVFGMPFPNISCDGWICWGGSSIGGSFQTLNGLSLLIDRLFNSPFNNHVFNAGPFNHIGIRDHHDFFKYLQNKTRFPEELLLRTVNNMTIGSI